MILVKANKESEAGVMPGKELLAAMGNFNEELLRAGVLLAADGLQPSAKAARVRFSGLDLVRPSPAFNVYGENFPSFSSPGEFPPAKFVHEAPGRTGTALNSIVADGVIVSGSTVRSSIIGCGVYLHSYSVVEASVLFGGSMHGGYVTETDIGRHCRIRNAIIDKNVHLSEGTSIGYDRAEDERRGLRTVPIAGGDDHIVVVPKDFVL